MSEMTLLRLLAQIQHAGGWRFEYRAGAILDLHLGVRGADGLRDIDRYVPKRRSGAGERLRDDACASPQWRPPGWRCREDFELAVAVAQEMGLVHVPPSGRLAVTPLGRQWAAERLALFGGLIPDHGGKKC